VTRSGLLVLLVAVALSLPGCCGLARMTCGIEPPPSPPRLTRDTPHEAVDFLVDAFRNRRIQELYESLHSGFVAENGDFSASDFATGYERIEPELLADAEAIATAQRSDVVMRDGLAWIFVESGDRSVWLAFQNQPATLVKAEHGFLGRVELHGSVESLSASLEAGQDGLVVTRPVPLEGRSVDPASVLRVELHQDWLLRHVAEPRGIQFVDRMRELAQ